MVGHLWALDGGSGAGEEKKAKALRKTICASAQVAEEAPWQELPLVALRCKAGSCQKLPWSTCLLHACCFQPKLLSLIICVVETLNRDRAKVNKFHLGDIWGAQEVASFCTNIQNENLISK